MMLFLKTSQIQLYGMNLQSNKFEYALHFKCKDEDMTKTACMKEISLDDHYLESDHVLIGSGCSILEEEKTHSKRFKSSNFCKGEPSSSVNSGNNNGGVGGGVAQGSIVQQSNAVGGDVYGRGNRGTGNMPGMRNRVSASPMKNRGPGAVGGRGTMRGGNGFGEGIDEVLPLMYPQSIGFGLGFGAPMGWMGSYGGFPGTPAPPFSGVLSRCSIIDEEEARSNKRLKSSNFCNGESSSRSHPYTSLDLGAFPQDFVKSHPFTPLDLDELPQDSVASHVILISDSDEDNDGDVVKSQPFNPLELDEFPQDSVGLPVIIISDSDEDNDG
ncbi:hypothetical protein Patl1_07758 [Pistacia atlantica]|uniref:Uncharacterized protein n=1 Tax=Pistacia atlantica TaxID=434234 RepID=A0ACC1AIE6_9ROSI|nr:hypothetical protein Patl1_07758 [Pistacia atlantica]